MRLAADVGGGDQFGFTGLQRLNLLFLELLGKFRLQNRVSTCRATAQMRIGYRREFKTEIGQELFRFALEFLPMLERARGVKGDATRLVCRVARAKICPFGIVLFGQKYLDGVARQGGNLRGLGGVIGILCEGMAVVLDLHAAAAGRDDNGFGTGFDEWPPGIDVAAHGRARGFFSVQVLFDRTAAAGRRGGHEADAQGIEHAACGPVDVG